MFSPGIPFKNCLNSTQHHASDNLVTKQKLCFNLCLCGYFLHLFFTLIQHPKQNNRMIIPEGSRGKLEHAVMTYFKTLSQREYHEKSVIIASAWPKLETSTSKMYYHHAVSLCGTKILIWFRKRKIFYKINDSQEQEMKSLETCAINSRTVFVYCSTYNDMRLDMFCASSTWILIAEVRL
jgi:hypothetical protein